MRTTSELASEIDATYKDRGFKTKNDLYLKAISQYLRGASYEQAEPPQAAASVAIVAVESPRSEWSYNPEEHGEAPTWPKPIFPAQAYHDDGAARIKAARISLWFVMGPHLEYIDNGARQIEPSAEASCWAEYYEQALAHHRKEAEAPQAAVSVAIVAPTPVQLPDPRTEEELELRFIEEDQAILDQRALTNRSIEYQAHVNCWTITHEADVRREIKENRALEDQRRTIEKKRRHAALLARLTFAALVQPGTPQTHRQYEPRSAWATEGGATRQDRAALVRSFRRPGKPKDDS